jgi:hypothetical protein
MMIMPARPARRACQWRPGGATVPLSDDSVMMIMIVRRRVPVHHGIIESASLSAREPRFSVTVTVTSTHWQ